MRRDRGPAGRGAFPPGQIAEVKALACELPAQSGVPLSRWSAAEVARAAIERGIVAQVSGITVWRWLREDAIRPWNYRSWIFPRDPRFAEKAGPILDLYEGQPQFAALADEFTVVAWDEPGAGRSSDVPAGFGLADYASCLAALIEALALGPAHVTGLSWGGTVVQEFYRQHPGLVATLILVDTYAGWKGSLPAEEVRARVAGVERMLEALAEEFDPTLPGLFAGDPPAEFVPLLEEMAAAVRPDSLRTAIYVMAEADQRDLLPRIAVPTLLIWGERDARSPLGVARQFEHAIPDTKLVVIPGAGHVSNLEQPEQFNAAVREFCRGHSPRQI